MKKAALGAMFGVVVGAVVACGASASAGDGKPGTKVVEVGAWQVRKVCDNGVTLYFANDGNIAAVNNGCMTP